MTVNSAVSTASYTGNGVTSSFPIPFYFLVDTDLKVSRKVAATGVVSTLVLNSDYSLTGAGNVLGGALNMTAIPASGDQLFIERNIAFVQQTSYPEGNRFPSASHEKALDRDTMGLQQLDSRLQRALIREPLGSTYDLANSRLTNMAVAINDNDAVSKSQLDASIAQVAIGGTGVSTTTTIGQAPIFYDLGGTGQPALNVHKTFFYDGNAAPSDVCSLQVRRDCNYSGGSVGFLNSALLVRSIVNTTANPFECALFAISDNHSTGQQNFAMGAQANKYSTGPAWALVTEVHEKNGTADPTNATIGYELDVCANGTDVFFQRFGLAIIAKREIPAGAQCVVGTGISIAGENAGDAKYGVGISFGRSVVPTDFHDCMDSTNATLDATGLVLRTAADQRIGFTASGDRTIRYSPGAAAVRIEAVGKTFDFKDSGDFNVSGTVQVFGSQVVSVRRTGWGTPTGTTSRGAFDTASVTLPQLAQVVKGLIEDLKSHGLIGT